MSRERDEFIGLLNREYPHMSVTQISKHAGRLMRLGRQYARIQEAICNGDYPADNGERPVAPCPKCEQGFAAESIRSGLCPACRKEAEIRTACRALPGCEPIFGGDPRGATVKLRVPSGRTNDWGQTGICVPNS